MKNIIFYNKKMLILMICCFCIILSANNLLGSDLYSFDTKENGDPEIHIKFKEIKRLKQKSIVRIYVYKRGTYIGAITTTQCGLALLAKKRGFRYIRRLEDKNIQVCDECEWVEEIEVGFLNLKNKGQRKLLSGNHTNQKENVIEDINKYSLICGFTPIPDDPFGMAVYKNDIPKIESYLREFSININKKNEWGYSPLHIAVAENNYDAADKLIKAGADVNSHGPWLFTPLHLALSLKKQDDNVIKLLINSGAKLNSRAIYGITPIYMAVKAAKVEMVDYLLRLGVSISTTDDNGNTLLHTAVNNNRINIVKFLLKHGLSPNLRNKEGKKPLDLAVEKGFDNIKAILSNWTNGSP